jgi:hypothetical protein
MFKVQRNSHNQYYTPWKNIDLGVYVFLQARQQHRAFMWMPLTN